MAVLACLTAITHKRSTLKFHAYDFFEIVTMTVAYSALSASVFIAPFPVTSFCLVAVTPVPAYIGAVEHIAFFSVSVKLDFP
jgi:hypothetical protein